MRSAWLVSKEESSFSEEKEAKRLLSVWILVPATTTRTLSRKSFLVLFSKKNAFFLT
jgi:hypothetical protein